MENRDIYEEFSKIKKLQIIIPIIGVVIILAMVIAGLGKLSGFVVLGVLFFTWYNWKCPSCGKNLGKDRTSKCCPNCGAKLSNDKLKNE